MSVDVQAVTCPTRLLNVGDRIRLGDTILDVTFARCLPNDLTPDRVELSFMAVEVDSWAYSTDVLPPDLEVPIIHTATEGLAQ